MKNNYRIGRPPAKRRFGKFMLVLLIATALLGLAGYVIYKDIKKSESAEVQGRTNMVPQKADESLQGLLVDEHTFSMELPGKWKEVERVNSARERSIKWQSDTGQQDNRWLKIYVDTIPANTPINRLLPVSAQDGRIVYGALSDNCATFTGGGSLNTAEAVKLRPAPAKWQKVDFICDLPRVIDNQVGTGSAEDGMNTVKVRGMDRGEHSYFFLYTDRSFQPNHSVLYDALKSFRAK